ncbi:hypothetical protein BDB00DRAFT_816768 [Zychaea mexicana]|uniref:uncharacterized protein n=1 Tax=Zychaea mexicana TaxID=64656 RepID=UPI0022FE922A|nr:uncharacterized protein BDB00DRAFT_816768 [Zychaea mexicana]KAI9494717.1 hypothetical protein BDB00DRAFT_816768 [Zychaea mexicana]
MDQQELYTSTWNALGAFDYAAASKLATRFLRVYQPFSNLLVKLCNCENLYTQLSFLKPKWYYMRKDPLNLLYHYLAEETTKEIAVLESHPTTVVGLADTTPLLEILHALVDLCRVRQTFIHLYQALLSKSHSSSSSSSSTSDHGDASWPNTIRWFGKYLDNLYAKMTLYFNNILLDKEQLLTDDDPAKSLWKGIKIDYHDQICTFRKRFGAHCVGLIYEVTSAVPFHPQGYVLADTPYEAPQGIHSFPFIYCQPNQAPKEHMPNIISIIQGSRNKLSDPKSDPVYFYDSKIGSTYYLAQVDEHVVLVVIYLERQVPQREPTTLDFMASMVRSLRGTSVIADLSRME